MKNYKKIIGLSAMFLLTGGVVAATTTYYVAKNATPTHDGGTAGGDVTPIHHDNEETFVVSFDPNGGYIESGRSSTRVVENTTWASLKNSAPTVKKGNFTLNYWFTYDGTTEVQMSDSYKFTHDTVLYAKYSEFTVTFDANGGQFPSGDTSIQVTGHSTIYGDEVALPARPGYTFGHWFTGTDETVPVPFPFQVTATTTLKAHWNTNKITVVINAGIGLLNDNTKYKVKTYDVNTSWTTIRNDIPGTDHNAKIDGEEANYFEYDGWYNGDTKLEPTTTTTFSDDTVITAKFNNAIGITFRHGEGAHWSDASITTDEISETDKILNKQDNPTIAQAFTKMETKLGKSIVSERDGYVFVGWYDQDGNLRSRDSSVPDYVFPQTGEIVKELILTARFEKSDLEVYFNECLPIAPVQFEQAYDTTFKELGYELPTNVHRSSDPLEDAEFKGWYYIKNNVEHRVTVNTLLNESNGVVISTNSTSIYDLHARFYTYTLKFDVSGVSSEINAKYNTSETSKTLSKKISVHKEDATSGLTYNDDYQIIGWKDEQGRPIDFPFKPNTATYGVPAEGGDDIEVKIIPVFDKKPDMCSVTFNPDGGIFPGDTTSTSKTILVEKNTIMGYDAPALPIKNGKRAICWQDPAGDVFHPFEHAVTENLLLTAVYAD